MRKEHGIFIGRENTDKEVIFEEYESEKHKNLELGKQGKGIKIVILDLKSEFN
ncbi:hypothetical protein [uncultured Clostridium sp.]|jgi:hypothetical protein|uniref:hypothetical protein n=1 Tax=uncultured Clostridium sp. TaxID=59620 RepID=UPI00258951E9|nr:hypothetical protein [uncultured Clostridium sp.]